MDTDENKLEQNGNALRRFFLALLFFGLLTPVAFVLRLLKKDPLRREINTTTKSYWLAVDATDPASRMFEQL
jgi:hypothetical protein